MTAEYLPDALELEVPQLVVGCPDHGNDALREEDPRVADQAVVRCGEDGRDQLPRPRFGKVTSTCGAVSYAFPDYV